MLKATHDTLTEAIRSNEDIVKLLPQQSLPEDISSFVFQNRQLFLWSDYRFVPSYNQLRGDYAYRLLNLNQGQYLVSKRLVEQQGSVLETYCLLLVYRRYRLENIYLESAYNPNLKMENIGEIIPQAGEGDFSYFSPKQEFLFDIKLDANSSQVEQLRLRWFWIILMLSFTLGGLFLGELLKYLHRHQLHELGLLSWVFYLAGIRVIMLASRFPANVYDWQLFDPSYYASSWLNPSLGDLLLNLWVSCFWVAYLLNYFHRFKSIKLLLRQSQELKYAHALISFLLAMGVGHVLNYLLTTIFLHSQLNLDITRNVDLSIYSFGAVLIFLGASVASFFYIHFFIRLYTQLSPKKTWVNSMTSLLSYGIYTVITLWYGDFHFVLGILSLLFLGVIYAADLPRFLYKFNYFSFIYLFAGAVFCASVGAQVIYNYGKKRSIEEKRNFASRLLPDTDEFAEFMLLNAMQEIQGDTAVKDLFKRADPPLESVKQKIKRQYLNNYFDRYQIQIQFFESELASNNYPERLSLGSSAEYQSFEVNFKKIYYETSQENIFFISKPGIDLIKRYLVFIEIEELDQVLGHIIIDLKQKRAIPTNVYPELLVDKNDKSPLETRDYNYAIYENDLLIYNVGDFNYEKNFPKRLFSEEALYIKGLSVEKYDHLALEGGFKKRVLVSSRMYSGIDLFSNFSFLFLALVAIIVSFIVVYSVSQQIQGVKVNFATRIQLYLNTAFFLPLLAVSISVLSIISNSYQEDFNRECLVRTKRIGANLSSTLENYLDFKLNREQLSEKLSEISELAELDVNLFDPKGELIATSQPAIYESGLLSRYLHPKALGEIRYRKTKQVMLRESVGTLAYQSAYVPVRSYESGELIGIISVPFFESQYELDKKLIEILSTIVNIFATIFIVFIILSYFASQILTIPLRLITQKIRKTTFYNYNEALEWNSKDEIGLFVEEYNKMLQKLDKSKEALVRSQKESAWREIAQQVAHEIKNPLTPMKLTLQHMQLRLQNQGEKVRNAFERSFDMLLNQVDTLSDIATSFSSFAKMPIPISERFEINEVLRDSYSLYNNEDIQIKIETSSREYFVRGDKKLMGRIFTNLIKNAKEAVAEDRKPRLIINLNTKVEGLVLIEFKDNGSGIPKDVQDKIFMPNFSTKSTGSGIGLAVAKRGIEHAGGRIWFKTDPQNGTSFFVELPLID